MIFATNKVLAYTSPPTNIVTDTVWTKDKNPYLIGNEGVTVTNGATLTIKSGVVVMSSSSTDPYDKGYISVNNAQLKVLGKGLGSDRVLFSDLLGIDINNSNFNIENADFRNNTNQGFSIESSVGTVSTTTISNSSMGIYIKDSLVDIRGSRIEDNNYFGITIAPHKIVLMRDDVQYDIGGEGNVNSYGISTTTSAVNITNSVIQNNRIYEISNNDTNTVNAKDNWWGKDMGPTMAKIKGKIDFKPWLNKEPSLDPGKDIGCCSNVLFLPGLQASRLYNYKNNSTNRLWEPFNNTDVQSLFLDNFGSSTDHSVFADEPIYTAYGLKDVYKPFADMLDTLVIKGSINEWRSFGYDWRSSFVDIVEKDQKTATSTINLLGLVDDLAKRSKTGKIIIVGHSNGGLVGKYLVKILTENGKDDLIDKFISVGTPYFGTPKALLSILHGFGQAIFGGSVLNESIARELARNMIGGYTLLPSIEYFKKVLTPTIVFASSTIDGLNTGQYPGAVTDNTEQTAFLIDSKNVRQDPDIKDLSRPIKGNSYVNKISENIHSIIDAFSWPMNIGKYSVVGYNQSTPISLKYYLKNICSYWSNKCELKLLHEVIDTKKGDGTVIGGSASDGGDIISADLSKISDIEDDNINHANMLSSKDINNVINQIITSEDNVMITQNDLIKLGPPPDLSTEKSIVISTHSPVNLHVYDSKGRHVGSTSTISGVEEDLLNMYDIDIPGSSYNAINSFDGYERYVHLPFRSGEQYSVKIEGQDFGTFTYRVEEKTGDNTTNITEHKDVPVAPTSIATTTIHVADLISGNMFNASTTSILNLDYDGDGARDLSISTSSTDYNEKHMELIRRLIDKLPDNNKRKKAIITKLLKLEQVHKYNKSNNNDDDRASDSLKNHENSTRKLKLSRSDTAKSEKRRNYKHFDYKKINQKDSTAIFDRLDEIFADL
jgi:pimeloyl-ACP methyl ester carboxylesterase